MRLDGRDESSNIEDRRGIGARHVVGGAGGLGIVGVILYLLLGGDPQTVMQQMNQGAQTQPEPGQPYQESSHEAQDRHLVSIVLRDTEKGWQEIFAAAGRTYVEPKLVLFTDAVQSACGSAETAMGPFYCPGDQKVYIDLSFFDELSSPRFGVSGGFAKAYVVAHEIGHHVQKLLGITDQVDAARQRQSEAQVNAMSVRLELQADCFAGIWAHNANESRQLLESGDIESGLQAAAAVGDDRLQRQARGYVQPESFTHGTSEQRMRWFKRGYETGRTDNCNTFSKEASRSL
jgi:uncharacterized protein